ncbi:hypothetical protein GE09DRAFT_1143144 [Coniochaeta sp. 2T2.1]|nr:hypothetical protein GE09DRAFT_1143144 [Coniochaeta sp. 2T2.1]
MQWHKRDDLTLTAPNLSSGISSILSVVESVDLKLLLLLLFALHGSSGRKDKAAEPTVRCLISLIFQSILMSVALILKKFHGSPTHWAGQENAETRGGRERTDLGLAAGYRGVRLSISRCYPNVGGRSLLPKSPNARVMFEVEARGSITIQMWWKVCAVVACSTPLH